MIHMVADDALKRSLAVMALGPTVTTIKLLAGIDNILIEQVLLPEDGILHVPTGTG